MVGVVHSCRLWGPIMIRDTAGLQSHNFMGPCLYKEFWFLKMYYKILRPLGGIAIYQWRQDTEYRRIPERICLLFTQVGLEILILIPELPQKASNSKENGLIVFNIGVAAKKNVLSYLATQNFPGRKQKKRNEIPHHYYPLSRKQSLSSSHLHFHHPDQLSSPACDEFCVFYLITALPHCSGW